MSDDAEALFHALRHLVQPGGNRRQRELVGTERDGQAERLQMTQRGVDFGDVIAGKPHDP